MFIIERDNISSEKLRWDTIYGHLLTIVFRNLKLFELKWLGKKKIRKIPCISNLLLKTPLIFKIRTFLLLEKMYTDTNKISQ